jgi:von Willebrand factor type A domain.
MKKSGIFLCILVFFTFPPLLAGERTVPVDIFLMIDKSLSMAESGKYDSLHRWVQTQLIDQILIDGDWITIYQFYGKTDRLLTMTVSTPADRSRITGTIGKIQPDGQYTDIGLALDTMNDALARRGTNGRHKILLLLTDLKQEAPWTSRYAGSPDSFESPYLAEARILEHDRWYEITLDMDIQDAVVKTSRELYSAMQEPRPEAGEAGSADRAVSLDGTDRATQGSGNPQAGEKNAGASRERITGRGPLWGTLQGSLPFFLFPVLLSVIISIFVVLLSLILRNRKAKKNTTD